MIQMALPIYLVSEINLSLPREKTFHQLGVQSCIAEADQSGRIEKPTKMFHGIDQMDTYQSMFVC